MIIHVESVEQFKKEVAAGTVLVDFFATWCGPCNMLTPVIEEYVSKTDLKVLKIDCDELGELAASFGVMSIPTLILYKEGKPVKKELGYKNLSQLTAFIEQ